MDTTKNADDHFLSHCHRFLFCTYDQTFFSKECFLSHFNKSAAEKKLRSAARLKKSRLLTKGRVPVYSFLVREAPFWVKTNKIMRIVNFLVKNYLALLPTRGIFRLWNKPWRWKLTESKNPTSLYVWRDTEKSPLARIRTQVRMDRTQSGQDERCHPSTLFLLIGPQNCTKARNV